MRAARSATATFRNGEALHAMGMLHALRAVWDGYHGAAMRGQAKASDRVAVALALSRFVRTLLQIAILGLGAYLAIDRKISPGAMVAA